MRLVAAALFSADLYPSLSLSLSLSLQLLRKCILQMTRPVVEGSLGSPPFEKPNIEQVG